MKEETPLTTIFLKDENLQEAPKQERLCPFVNRTDDYANYKCEQCGCWELCH